MKLIDLLLVAACILVVAGVSLISVPAGLISAGLSCGAAWFLLGDPK